MSRIRRHRGWWEWSGGPVPPGAAAVTLGPLVIVRSAIRLQGRLLRHELVHVGQWRRLGIAGFLRRYLGAYLALRAAGWSHWPAYRRIPLEVEAEWLARTELPVDGAR